MRELGAGADLIALDVAAENACDEAGARSRSLAEFCSAPQFRDSFVRYFELVEEAFAEADADYSAETGFPRTLRSNIYHFQGYFADLQYLSTVSRALLAAYGRVRILSSTPGDFVRSEDTATTAHHIFDDSIVSKPDAGAFNVAVLSRLLQQPAEFFDTSGPRRQWPSRFQHHRYLLRPKHWPLLFEKLGTRHSFDLFQRRAEFTAWVIQDGFDVAPLRKYLPEARFRNPRKSIQARTSDLRPRTLRPSFMAAAAALGRLWPESVKQIFSLLESYHEHVARNIPAAETIIREQLKIDRPSAAMFAIGAGTAYEELCGRILNQERIPVFMFQHGGSNNTYYSTPFNRYYEFPPAIRHVSVCVPRTEEHRRHLPPEADVFVAGSVKLSEWHRGHSKKGGQTCNGRVLLVQGRYPVEAWKNLFCAEDEHSTFVKHRDLFSLAGELGLALDVKLFPQHATAYGEYFHRLAKRFGVGDCQMISSGPAELVCPEYSLIVMEYIGSGLNPYFFVLDRPVIYYLAENFVPSATQDDFARRHYMARDRGELQQLLARHVDGKLPSQFDSGLVDRYVYAQEGELPGARIARRVRADITTARAGSPSVAESNGLAPRHLG